MPTKDGLEWFERQSQEAERSLAEMPVWLGGRASQKFVRLSEVLEVVGHLKVKSPKNVSTRAHNFALDDALYALREKFKT